MSTNQPADQLAPSVFDGIRELTHEIRQELLPRVPWRAAALWGVALGATFVIRGVYDLLQPTTDWALRSHWSTRAGLAICFCAGFQAAWRRKDFAHGGVVTLVAILISSFVAIVGGVAAVLVISTFHRLDLAKELYGANDVPLFGMFFVGAPVGILGSAIAVGLTRLKHRTVMQS
jgi:hypothetical protein